MKIDRSARSEFPWFWVTTAALLLLLVVSCSAAVGASWNRHHCVTLTAQDALRILSGEGESFERERAMAELADLSMQISAAIGRAGADGARESKYALPWLEQMRCAVERAKAEAEAAQKASAKESPK